MEKYLFFRKEPNGMRYFYEVELKDDKDAMRNVDANPGTVRVEHISGRVVYPAAVH
jgi:hypothetical protein